MRIEFTVYGVPQQRGSKQAHVQYDHSGKPVTKNGRVLTFAKDGNAKSKDWMALVRQVAADKMNDLADELIDAPIRLSVRFHFQRPKAHYRTGKNAHLLRDDAPMFHAKSPDLDKLVRCIGDALTGVVWTDDKLVCCIGETGREWTENRPRAEVVIETLGGGG